jgi:GT2 family glycosyltransferase
MILYTGSIVLFQNDPKILLEAIKSFLDTPLNVRLFLIDNSPTNILSNVHTDNRISYIHNPTNPGFGAAHNVAIKEAFNLQSKYHLVLNPDVFFEGEIIEKIVRFMDNNKDVGNLMPDVKYPDGSTQYLCKLLPTPYDWIGRRFNPFTSFVDKRNYVFEMRFTNYNKTIEVPYLSGCFMFLRVESLKKVGLFDESIFMYGEEVDLCRRLISSGYKSVFFPEVSIRHYFEKGSHKSLRLTIIGIQSAFYYFNKWGWFFDNDRKYINQKTLKSLGYSSK